MSLDNIPLRHSSSVILANADLVFNNFVFHIMLRLWIPKWMKTTLRHMNLSVKMRTSSSKNHQQVMVATGEDAS